MRSSTNSDGTVRLLSESIECIGAVEKEDSRTPARILVVDHELATCTAFESLLTEAGHKVQSCLSGRVAMAKLKQSSPDFVDMDLSMPSIDGSDVLKKAQELGPVCEVIVITGHAAPQSVVQVMNLGACGCIRKRLDIDEIRVVIDSPHGGAEWHG